MGEAQRNIRRSTAQNNIELWELREGGAGDARRKKSSAGARAGQTAQRRTGSSRSGQPGRRNAQEVQLIEPTRWRTNGARAAQTSQRRTGGARPAQKHMDGLNIIEVNPRQTGNPRPAHSIKRRKARRRRAYICRALAVAMVVFCLAMIYVLTGEIYKIVHEREKGEKPGIVETVTQKLTKQSVDAPDIIEDYIVVNDYSRPGTELKKVKSIFVHYTANPGTTAAQNRSYFASLAETHERSASAHFIIGYEGEIIQCIPLNEEAYAVATRNGDSVSIECCYLSEDGSFTQATYDTLVQTLAWLVDKYHLSTNDILRHYDCGGKKCPVYYVEHEEAWERLLSDVEAYENPEAEQL